MPSSLPMPLPRRMLPGADDDADLAADFVGGLNLGGDFPEGGGVDAEAFFAGKRLPAYLEEDPFATFGHGGWP